jgi:hypothetical protein
MGWRHDCFARRVARLLETRTRRATFFYRLPLERAHRECIRTLALMMRLHRKDHRHRDGTNEQHR